MLTKDQLAKIAYHHRVALAVQERDYIQHLFLSLLYNQSHALVFKGGTALRVVYNFSRYSEDLDFNSSLPAAKVKKLVLESVERLADFGIKAEFRRLKIFKENVERGLTGDISYQGPLFTGQSVSKGKVRVDVSLRGEEGETKRIVVASQYADVAQFVLTALRKKEIFAEKVRALIIRAKPRDLYDVWVLLGGGAKINYSLINKKLKLYQKTFALTEFKSKVKEAGSEWEDDLQGLLPQVAPAKEVEKTVIAAFAVALDKRPINMVKRK